MTWLNSAKKDNRKICNVGKAKPQISLRTRAQSELGLGCHFTNSTSKKDQANIIWTGPNEKVSSNTRTMHKSSACSKSLQGICPSLIHSYSNILKILPPKNENFQIKNSDIFHISAQNIDRGYSLEPPRRGGSNEYPQSMFLSILRKIIYTPVNPSFTL